jgi:hypothetical protein
MVYFGMWEHVLCAILVYIVKSTHVLFFMMWVLGTTMGLDTDVG